MACAAELEQIVQLVAEGRIKPRIGKGLPLSEAKQADDLCQFGHPHGKVLLKAASPAQIGQVKSLAGFAPPADDAGCMAPLPAE